MVEMVTIKKKPIEQMTYEELKEELKLLLDARWEAKHRIWEWSPCDEFLWGR